MPSHQVSTYDGRSKPINAMLQQMCPSRMGFLRACLRGRFAAPLAVPLGLCTVASCLAGCGGAASRSIGSSHAPVGIGRSHPITVVASVYPLAQLAGYIGAGDVHVIDLVPPGQQPQGMGLGTAQRALLRSADLVVDVGYGYQPQIEAAAAQARRHLAVLPAISKQAEPYQFWLDPYLMASAAGVIAARLVAADPPARQQFENGLLDFQSVASSLESDFVNTFTQCQSAYLVTADDAFGRMAESFELVDVPVNTAGTTKALATITTHDLPAVFSEVGAPSGEIDQVARTAAHVNVDSLDPLELTPGPGDAATSYFARMEQDLTAMEGLFPARRPVISRESTHRPTDRGERR